jgi:hypothetical protein
VWINGIDPERLAVVRRKIFLTHANTNRKVKTSLFRRHNFLLLLLVAWCADRRRHLTRLQYAQQQQQQQLHQSNCSSHRMAIPKRNKRLYNIMSQSPSSSGRFRNITNVLVVVITATRHHDHPSNHCLLPSKKAEKDDHERECIDDSSDDELFEVEHQ